MVPLLKIYTPQKQLLPKIALKYAGSVMAIRMCKSSFNVTSKLVSLSTSNNDYISLSTLRGV
jgi:hypothetical protein